MKANATYIEQIAIPAHLKDVELEHNVRILLAVESGSRAWGFESANSDWDVRFIYVHKPEWYFMIDRQRDVIEHVYDDDVDLAGWDLRKALSLLKSSNPSMFEWLASPKVYFVDADFRRRIDEVKAMFFNPIKVMYHYNHIYSGHDEKYLQKEDCSMKRFLYYLRGVLACRWIEQNESLPPVAFDELVAAVVNEDSIKASIEKLIQLKKSGTERDLHVIDKELMSYARHWADVYNERIDSFRPDLHKASTETLDSIMRDITMNRMNL